MRSFEIYRDRVEEALQSALPAGCSWNEGLLISARYSLLANSKRLRPVLTLMAADYMNVPLENAMPVACSVEMIHTYSLIHDDLPCMDDDAWRRGKPTNHVLYGEAMALLAGDGLLTHAFSSLSAYAVTQGERAYNYLLSITQLSAAAGLDGMVGGQSQDILQPQVQHPCDVHKRLDYIHEHKTAALLRGAVLAGLVLGNPDKAIFDAFSVYATHLGHGFQIADDLLDIEANAQVIGKTPGKDARAGKLTYPSLVGIDAAREALHTHTQKAADALHHIADTQDFINLVLSLASRNK